MDNKNRFYKDINLIRLVSCIAVLLYHLNILKGGYLAVCTFFVISGYLTCRSALKKENFSFKEYYKNKLLKIYLPLLIVVFLTTFTVPLLKDINWLNLKPETTSAILGYNNYWQLGANLDYFSRHIDSPFVHLWYIGILLQFDIVFPFIYKILKKSGEKIHKIFPCILTLSFAILGTVYFYYMSRSANIMTTYYDTFTRSFSLLFGVGVGFIHHYYGALVPKFLRGKFVRTLIKLIYLALLIASFVLIGSDSQYFAIAMIIVTLVSCRLIDYATVTKDEKRSLIDKIVSFFSGVCYEVYLFQYPVIFIFQHIDIEWHLKLSLIIATTLLLSFVLHRALNFNRNPKMRVIKYLLLLIIFRLAFQGAYTYIITEDHTAELKKLESQLAENEKMLAAKQEEYASKMKEEEEKWNDTLKGLATGEIELKEYVANLPVVGIGDSVMLGAIDNLYDQFANGYFDAKISRSIWSTNGIIKELEEDDLLGDPIVISLGANGDCTETCKAEIIKTCENHKVFWLTVTNDSDVHVNDNLVKLANEHSNVYIIDWNAISKDHPEYFYADRIHLTGMGRIAYTQAIYDKIYEVYLEEYNEKRDSILNEHEENIKNKMSFYGNALLLNAFESIEDAFKEARFTTDKEFASDSIEASIKKAKKDGILNHRVIFAFDKKAELTVSDYRRLIDLVEERHVYIVNVDSKLSKELRELANKNVTIIDFAPQIDKNDDFVIADGIHLTDKGNRALTDAIVRSLK